MNNKLNRIKSEIDSLKMFPYKPERIDTDDELEWEEEEQQLQNILYSDSENSVKKHKLYCKLECESEL